jgi:hypothetical protein
MMREEDEARRPLPVGLRPIPDKLLSSWLARHAAYCRAVRNREMAFQALQ